MRQRFVQVNGELVEVGKEWRPDPKADHHIMPDIQPYQSMIDGSWITSRSRHREHLRAHDCVEIGNDSSLHAKPKPLQPPPGLKETIVRVANEKLRRI